MSDPSSVLREKRGGALWITINRADRRNAINADVLGGIAQGYREAQMDAAIRVIVLTGAGDKAFCAGADLNPGQSLTFDYSQPTTAYADLLRLARACPIPTVARVNGACVAGGMGLLCMADIAIASDRATFSLPEVRIGLFPAQVVALLKELIPSRVLHEWCLTGQPVDAAAARLAGLINHVVPQEELDIKVGMIVEQLVATSPSAVRRGKYILRSMLTMSTEEALAFGEGQLALTALTEDAREGIAAFNEKRLPAWTGK